MEDLTGKQLGHYQIVASLGEGGMAAVYKAYQPAMDRYVALKVLPRHFASDPEFVKRFQQEAKVLAKLQHPHILPVFDFGEADGYTYIVMPFVQSGTLAELIIGQSLPWPQIYNIISQMGDALDYAHAHGLIHRDVKPTNILIDDSGHCLLTDFGLAKIMEGSVHLTTSGAIMGTPAYMSPEQGMGRKLDGRTDVYSLGVILYELTTGRAPYLADTPMAVMIKHISDPLPLPRDINPEIPGAIERVILKALSKDPEDRFATAGDMVLALQAAMSRSADVETPEMSAEILVPTSSLAATTPPPLLPTTASPTPAPTALPLTYAPQSISLTKPLVFLGIAVIIAASIITVPALFGLFNPRPASTQRVLPTAPVEPTAVTPSPTPQPTLVPTASEIPASPTPVPSSTPAVLTGRIAFVSGRDQDEEIYVMNADGSNQVRLTYSQYADNEPMFSPDGRLIVFVSQRAGGHKLFIMNADGSDQRQLTDGQADQEYDPYFSPDGQWIIYSSSRGGRYELWLIQPDGMSLRQLTSGPNAKNLPAWSPDGQWIAYNSVEAEGDVIKIIRPDGTDDRVLLQQEDAYVSGWSGGRILFVAPTGAKTDIYSMNLDGTDIWQLTSDPANDKGAYGTLDGRFIIFNSARDGNDEIYVMRPDGSGQTRLTFNTGGNDFMATWGP